MPRALIPALLTAVLLAGGCADDAEPRNDAGLDRDDKQTTPSATPDPTPPSATPSRSEPTSTSSASAKPSKGVGKIAPTPLPMARPDGSRTHLLTASTLPAAGDGAAWTVRSTGPEGSRRVGACQQTSLEDIGALHAVIRLFTGPDGSGLQSRQLVARLADAKSAWRTHKVLRSWRADCEERLDYPTKAVGPMKAVALDAATGGHYRATYGPKQDTDVAGLGIVRSGRWLSIVEITATEGAVPRAWTRRAVRRIAATFG